MMTPQDQVETSVISEDVSHRQIAGINPNQQNLDRKRAYHLEMTYEDFIKRKAELMRQIEKVKETQAP